MIKPINNTIQLKVEEETFGGIIVAGGPVITEIAKVIATSTSTKKYLNKKVLFKGYNIDTVTVGDEELVFMDAKHIIALA